MTKTCMQCNQYMYCSGKRPGGPGCLKTLKRGKEKILATEGGQEKKSNHLRPPIEYLCGNHTSS